ncbi:hypothetical protein V6Z11_D09G201400 [Gossypium hirsutum]
MSNWQPRKPTIYALLTIRKRKPIISALPIISAPVRMRRHLSKTKVIHIRPRIDVAMISLHKWVRNPITLIRMRWPHLFTKQRAMRFHQGRLWNGYTTPVAVCQNRH